MVQAIWGVDAQLRDTVRRYAKEGYLCIAPSLYQRSHPPSGDGRSDIAAFAPQAQALKDDVVMGDLLAGREWLRSKAAQSKIGITGFCMGGGIVIKQLIGSHAYDAASVFYGDVRPGVPRDAPTTPDTFAYAKQIATPVRGNYGARDTSIKPDDVRAMFAELSVPHSLDIYDDAGHAFFDDTRNRYVARAASDAWSKTLAWFHTYLT
jgi:carboxymethylenebutenolidase